MENQYLKKIIAQTPEDLHIISACCSEGKVNIDDVKYLASNKIFLISIARFSKEEENKNKLIKKSKYNEVLKIAKKAHHVLGCKGVTRSDFKFYNNKFYLLETNTQPGMTSLSLVPEIASYKGISFESLVKKILLNASVNR